MPLNVTQKLIKEHLVSGEMEPGSEIALKIDQTLCQDATGTMVMLELEAMGVKKPATEVSVQYIDHNLVQNDYKNADDHRFLHSACKKFGIHFSRAGNGVSHAVHMETFGVPGQTMLGSDSHTCAAGSMGMLALGAGGLDVAAAIAGKPFYLEMPSIVGVKLTGELPDWVSAKDVILELLRRKGVSGGVKKIFEYYGPGLKKLSAMDRHVIANMGAELGATTTVFPSDEKVREYLEVQHRGHQFKEYMADKGSIYDEHLEINLSALVPLIACPTSPGNVVPVSDVAGKVVHQCMIGSSANPGLRDFAIAALIMKGRQVQPHVSFDVNPSSRQVLENMVVHNYLEPVIRAGARIHQAGCNGCIGMGQAPATKTISLRTVPRNFPGRSGTMDDLVYLCSPEVAAASALTGVITDPRTLDFPYPQYEEPKGIVLNVDALTVPTNADLGSKLEMGPNIKPLPDFPEIDDSIKGPVMLKVGADVSTDEILPAGSRALPLRSNIPEISKFTFDVVDNTFYERAIKHQESGFMIVALSNYGQGSSREHAVLAPKYLGLKCVIARSYARIHRKNLINFGVVPLLFNQDNDPGPQDREYEPEDYRTISQTDVLQIPDLRTAVDQGKSEVVVKNLTQGSEFKATIHLKEKEREEILAGGLMNLIKQQQL